MSHSLSWSAGIPVALDDFGTGVASLQQLAELPATDLKIGGSFVARTVLTLPLPASVDPLLQFRSFGPDGGVIAMAR
ncbi:MAG: putative signal transduction protein with EAL and GGDEF domain [Acidimicrobiales bacterium]|jgi:predicted signal transduction protein with EAL and GGDEF domain